MSSDNHGPTDADLRRAAWGCTWTLITAIGILGLVWFTLIAIFV